MRKLLFLFLLCTPLAAQTVIPLASGGIGLSCNAVTASTSANPGTAGGCTSLALVTSGATLPGNYTWQILTTGSPASVTVNFMGSLDGTTWTQLDTASSATTKTVSALAYRFLGCVPATLTGGASPTVSCQISVATAGTSSGGAVASVFGRTGVVAATSGDYTCAQVTNCPATGASALDIATAGATSPAPAYSPAEGPTAVNPSVYTQDINGSWHQEAGIDTTTLPQNYPNSGPTGPAGTLLWTRRQYHRDTLLANQVDRNTFNGFNHAFGVGTSQENQDSTIGSWQQNGTMTISGGTVSAGVVQFNVGQSGWIVPGQIYTPAGLAVLTALNSIPLQVTSLPSNILVQLKAAPFTLHIANNASAGTTQYAGYINRGTNTLVGQTFVVAGFTNSANNGTFTCTANVATSITLNNPSGVSESPAITIIPTATAVIANVGQTSDTGTLDQYFYGLEGMQSELDVYGTPTFTSAVDGEVSTMSLQENALNASNVSSPSFGYNVLRATATKSGAGSINGNAFEMAAVNAAVHINNIANNGGGVFPAIVTNVTDVVGGAPSSIGAGIYINFTGANRLTLRNYGVYTQDFSKSYTVTSVNNNSGGATVYNGTFPTTGALAGQVFKVTGFTNAVNNGTFSVNSNTTTTLTLANASGTAETKTVVIQDLNDWSIYSTGGQVYLGGNISTYNGVNTAGQGIVPIYGATSQKAETTTADANVLTVTPTANAGTYRACVVISVSAATSGVIGWTLSWTDSNGNAQSNIAQALTQLGTAAPALTFTTSAAGNYSSCQAIDVNNAAAAIVVKWVGGGTTTAKMSATIEEII